MSRHLLGWRRRLGRRGGAGPDREGRTRGNGRRSGSGHLGHGGAVAARCLDLDGLMTMTLLLPHRWWPSSSGGELFPLLGQLGVGALRAAWDAAHARPWHRCWHGPGHRDVAFLALLAMLLADAAFLAAASLLAP
ncbi:unnamed protein product [Urochloa humidicola]